MSSDKVIENANSWEKENDDCNLYYTIIVEKERERERKKSLP